MSACLHSAVFGRAGESCRSTAGNVRGWRPDPRKTKAPRSAPRIDKHPGGPWGGGEVGPLGCAASAPGEGDDAPPAGRAAETVWEAVLQLPSELDLDGEPLAAEELVRLDQAPDPEFYQTPCFAQHVDDGFLHRLTELYERVLRPGSRVLDLCGSFDSHLPSPDGLPLGQITGHGMNDAELAANPRLDQFFTLDLNSAEKTVLPMQGGQVDAILCCCGFQYLTRPTAVLRECKRVLSPGGIIVISFSSHAWAEKAISGWLTRTDEQRRDLVESCLNAAGFSDISAEVSLPIKDATGDSPRAISDPFLAVVARHPAVPAAAGLAQAEQKGYHQTNASTVLMEANLLAGPSDADGEAADQRVSPATLGRWVLAFEAMREEAIQMGIPRSAVPKLPEGPSPEDIRAKRQLLSGMIASFMSADI